MPKVFIFYNKGNYLNLFDRINSSTNDLRVVQFVLIDG